MQRLLAVTRRLEAALAVALCVCLAPSIWAKTSNEKKEESARFLRLSQVQFEQGKTMQAMDSIQKALKLYPDSPEAHYFLGFMRYQQSEYKPAEKEFRKALKLNPYYTDAHNHLGLVYREMKEYDKSLAEFQLALNDKSYKSQERIHFNIGHLYLARDMVPQAIASFQKAVALNPKYQRGFLGLGMAYARAGQKDLADKALQQVVALGPDSPEAAEARQLLDRKVKQAGS